jgi:DNA-directed RNA polymerase subunit RPC12/RpoP
MRRPNVLRPTVDLFERDGSVIDVNDLHRRGAFVGMWFPFKRLRTYPDRLEIKWPDHNKTPQIILIERTRLHLGGTRPWFLCYKCGRKVGKLYISSIDIGCRRCSDLQFVSQRQRRRARLKTKVEKIRNRLWFESGNPIRPRYMHRATYQKHLTALHAIQHAISTGCRISSPRYRRWRGRDDEGRYCGDS